MSEFTAPVLPLDIIENIVDMLASDDVENPQYVKTFSLICQSFLPLCRKYIFSSINIKIQDGYSMGPLYYSAEAFAQFLSGTPAIAKYIRQLNVVIVQQKLNLPIIQQPHSEYGYCFGDFDKVPPQLTRLQSLTVAHWTTEPTDWNNNSSLMQRSLLNIMRLPTLNHLSLRWISNFPISELMTCINLKRLSLEDMEDSEQHITGEYDEAASSLLRNPIRLQALDITIMRGKFKTLRLLGARCSDGRPFLDITGLEKIFVCVYQIEHAVPTREIIRNLHQLTDFHFEGGDICFRVMEFAKTVKPSLETLRRIQVTITPDGLNDPLAGLCDQLEVILGNNRLESLKIQIEVQTDEDCHSGDEWGRLEKVLLKSGWPMLKHVSLAIVLFSYWREDPSHLKMTLKNLPQTQFTRLMSRKSPDFRFSVRMELV